MRDDCGSEYAHVGKSSEAMVVSASFVAVLFEAT
jgi:hypothetical protein